MTNVEIFIKSLNLTWITRFLTTISSWIGIFFKLLGVIHVPINYIILDLKDKWQMPLVITFGKKLYIFYVIL